MQEGLALGIFIGAELLILFGIRELIIKIRQMEQTELKRLIEQQIT